MQEEPVRLVPHNAQWRSLFEAERAMLECALQPWLAGPIEHVGSTAVPGLIAKPVIDIMAGIEDLDAAVPMREAVAGLGYLYYPYRQSEMHWFCKPDPMQRTHHLHLVPVGSSLWRERLTFRDALRESPETAARYAALKRDLAARHEFDREAYTEGKSDFVNAVLSHAKLNAGNTWVVVPYRTEWPTMFAREADRLAQVFSGVEAVIEHIGSTAVPGLGAKPIIDIMIGLASLDEAERRVRDLAGIGYEYVPAYETELPDRRYFRKPLHRPRTHHLHIVALGSDFWTTHLLFRDYLRTHPGTAAAYYELKRRLARECSAAGMDYAEAKSPFVEAVLRLAEASSA